MAPSREAVPAKGSAAQAGDLGASPTTGPPRGPTPGDVGATTPSTPPTAETEVPGVSPTSGSDRPEATSLDAPSGGGLPPKGSGAPGMVAEVAAADLGRPPASVAAAEVRGMIAAGAEPPTTAPVADDDDDGLDERAVEPACSSKEAAAGSSSRNNADDPRGDETTTSGSSSSSAAASWQTLPSALLLEKAPERRLVVFLDYDGTLTPIVSDPAAARLSETMRDAVRRLAARAPVAVVSGRAREKIHEFVALSDLYVAGSHGFDIDGPNGLRHAVATELSPLLEDARDALTRELEAIPGVAVEDNRFALSVHWRNVAEQTDRRRVEQIVDAVLASPHYEGQLRKSHGKCVYELRPSVDWDKGKAVVYLLELLRESGWRSPQTAAPKLKQQPRSSASSENESSDAGAAAPPPGGGGHQQHQQQHHSASGSPESPSARSDAGSALSEAAASSWEGYYAGDAGSVASSASAASSDDGVAGAAPTSRVVGAPTSRPTGDAAAPLAEGHPPPPMPSGAARRARVGDDDQEVVLPTPPARGSGGADAGIPVATRHRDGRDDDRTAARHAAADVSSAKTDWYKSILPVYIGDDTTDEDAFGALKPLGGVCVLNVAATDEAQRPQLTQATHVLRGVQDVETFLNLLADV